MKMVKSLLLGAAAGLVAMSGAQAADLPVKAKPVEYVRICSLYGAGFFYIPGTDTCLKIGGYVSYEAAFGDASASHNQRFNGNIALNTRDLDNVTQRARANLSFDTRTASEYGVVRTFVLMDIFFNTSNAPYNTVVTNNNQSLIPANVFVQFAGFTFGKALPVTTVPFANTIWNTVSLFGYSNSSSAQVGAVQAIYTADLGNGLSISAGVEDATYGRNPLYDSNQAFTTPYGPVGFAANSFAGQHVPDGVGNIKFDQAWGSVFLGARVRNVNATYYSFGAGATGAPNAAFETNGHPQDRIGFGVIGGLQLKTLPTGVGDQIQLIASYGDGVTNTSGNAAPTSTLYAIRGRGPGGGGNTGIAYGAILDGVFAPGGRIQLTKSYGVQAGFEHYWVPGKWRTSIFGGYGEFDYNNSANASLCASLRRTPTAGGQSYTGNSCDFDLRIYGVGSRTVWTPVRGLDLSAEVMYNRVDQRLNGTINPAAAAFIPAGPIALRDQDVITGSFRIIRVF